MHHTWRLGLGWIGTFSLLGAACSLQTSGLSPGPSESSTASAGTSGPASTLSAGSSGSGGAGPGAGGSDGGTTGMGGSGGGTGAGGDAGPKLEVAGALLVHLDAHDLNTDVGAWPNKGTLPGPFVAQGQPKLVMSGSLKAVEFDGNSDAYIGPMSVASIEGNGDRSIEVWVKNPSLGLEEAMVSWSNRDKQENGTMMSFNYGFDLTFGAVTHWGQPTDLGWGKMSGDIPMKDAWHHLAYTFDGTTARVYADGIEKTVKDVMINTKPGFSINLAAERDKNGLTLHSALQLAIVRVHDGALTAAQVKSNFEFERSQFP